MKKIEKYIEIVSCKSNRLSSMSSKSRMAIKKVLEKYYANVNISIVNNLYDLEQLAEKKPDLVFLGTKRVPVKEHSSDNDDFVWPPDFLEERGIAVTGSSSDALKIEQDKTKAKNIMINAGLATSEYFLARQGQYTDSSKLPLKYPLFLKPFDLGGGFGVDDDSVVRNFEEFDIKMKSLATDSVSSVLVEKYLPGKEITVAVLQTIDNAGLLVMPIERIIPINEKGDKVTNYEIESIGEDIKLKAVEDDEIKQAVVNLARDAFIAIGARDYGRIDIMLDENNTPHFLEANLIPSLISSAANFPTAYTLKTNKSYDELLLQIVELAFNRAEARASSV